MSVTTSQTEPAGQSYLKIISRNAAGQLKALRKRYRQVTVVGRKSGQLIVEWTTASPGSTKTRVERASVVVSFLDIGQPQVIRVPAHAYETRRVG